MNVRIKLLALAGMVVVAACAPDTSEQPAQTMQIGIDRGATPVGMTLERLDGDGGSLDLSESIGRKPVLLEFWATWCEN